MHIRTSQSDRVYGYGGWHIGLGLVDNTALYIIQLAYVYSYIMQSAEDPYTLVGLFA